MPAFGGVVDGVDQVALGRDDQAGVDPRVRDPQPPVKELEDLANRLKLIGTPILGYLLPGQ
jgi:hypothetical protein